MSSNANKAAWISAPKATPLEVGPAPMPTPQGTEVTIQIHSVALNPADPVVQRLAILLEPKDYPFILGCDMAGTVVAVGPSSTFKPGERVIALAASWGRKDPKYGAFQLYALADTPFLTKIPDNVSFNEGCVLGLGLTTAAYALFNPDTLALDLPKPGGNAPNGKIVLVWGGASSVGACGIQAAKAAGYTIASTASARNFELLREMGVEYMFDYSSATVIDDIVAALKGKGEMAGIFSAIGKPETLVQCAAVIQRLEGRQHVATVRPPGFPAVENWPEGVEISNNASSHMKSEVSGAVWGAWLEGALRDGSMKCRPKYEVVGKGLEAVQDAMDLMSKGVSAKKLVVEFI
ncbi:chaperonin 10-like protein [Favolaschia claudopus]|uniref:Chaperonin 10-like protein n=1 Tax=Favolaschia claudopus TaxID=2862362 RepID=A0AAW0CLE1_9AGAR